MRHVGYCIHVHTYAFVLASLTSKNAVFFLHFAQTHPSLDVCFNLSIPIHLIIFIKCLTDLFFISSVHSWQLYSVIKHFSSILMKCLHPILWMTVQDSVGHYEGHTEAKQAIDNNSINRQSYKFSISAINHLVKLHTKPPLPPEWSSLNQP